MTTDENSLNVRTKMQQRPTFDCEMDVSKIMIDLDGFNIMNIATDLVKIPKEVTTKTVTKEEVLDGLCHLAPETKDKDENSVIIEISQDKNSQDDPTTIITPQPARQKMTSRKEFYPATSTDISHVFLDLKMTSKNIKAVFKDPVFKCLICEKKTTHVDCETCNVSICAKCECLIRECTEVEKQKQKLSLDETKENCINCFGTFQFEKMCKRHILQIFIMRDQVLKCDHSILRTSYGNETPSVQQIIDVCFKKENKPMCIGCFECVCEAKRRAIALSLKFPEKDQSTIERMIVSGYYLTGERICMNCISQRCCEQADIIWLPNPTHQKK